MGSRQHSTANMKAILAFVAIFLAVFISFIEAAPSKSDAEFDFDVFQPYYGERSERHRRVTCDLLSLNTKWGSFGHAACAGHCLVKGFRGGYCDGHGICNCRH